MFDYPSFILAVTDILGYKNFLLEYFCILKKVYGNASVVADDRVVFNIMGNKYWLVVRISFEFKAIQIKWFGSHAEYDKKIKPNSPAGEKVQVALLLVKQYEDEHYPIPVPDPIEVIKLKMQERGIKNKDLVGKVGSKGYVSSILNKRKPLTLELAKFFQREFSIPAEVLLA